MASLPDPDGGVAFADADGLLARAEEQVKRFQDEEAIRLASEAWASFRQKGDLSSSADAVRVVVAAKTALLCPAEAVEAARKGLEDCRTSRGRQSATRKAEAKMLLATAEAAAGQAPFSLGRAAAEEAIGAAERAHDTFLEQGETLLRAETCLSLVHLHIDQSCAERAARASLAQKAGKLARELADVAGNARCQGRAGHAMASALFFESQGSGEEWAPAAEAALEIFQDEADLQMEVEVRVTIASWHLQQENYAAALEHAREALDILQEQGAGSHRHVGAAGLACRASLQLGNRQQALRYAREALRLARTEGSLRAETAAANLLAATQLAAEDHGKISETLRTAERALSLSQQQRDLPAEAEALQSLLQVWQVYHEQAQAQCKGEELTENGNDESPRKAADAVLQQATAVLGKLSTAGGLTFAIGLLQRMSLMLAALGKPLEISEVGAHLREAVRGEVDAGLEASLLLCMGRAMFEGGKMKECCSSAQEAARLFEAAGRERETARALCLLSQAQISMGKCTAGRQNARRARRRFGEIGDHDNEVAMRIRVARACLLNDEKGNRQLKDALHDAQEAVKLAVDTNKPEVLLPALACFAEVCCASGKHEETLSAVEDAREVFASSGKAPDAMLAALVFGAKACANSQQQDEAKKFAEEALQLEQQAKQAGGLAEQEKVRASVSEARELLQTLQATTKAVPLLQSQQQAKSPPEQQPQGSFWSSTGLRCPKCGHEEKSLQTCASCSTHLPWPDCKFCPECGAKQPERQLRIGPEPLPASQLERAPRKPAVQSGFLSRAMQREETDPLKKRMQEITGNMLGLDVETLIEGDVALTDVGISSGAAVMLRDELQADVKGIKLPATLLFDYPTINEVIGFITGKLR